MKILACDGIHADGLTLFEQAGFSVETSDPIKDAAVLAEKLKDFVWYDREQDYDWFLNHLLNASETDQILSEFI